MIFRFSLYGFLKNLRFFEAFLILALRERGLDFLNIGGLIAVREIASNISQIPSGVLADTFGRRRCMIVSMAGYVLSYLALGLTSNTWLLIAAMILYGTADSFRDGTHKALIYTWLRQHGREHQRTQIYGYTRSWSKLGSALSAIIAATLVFTTGNFTIIFLCSAIPAAANLINLATYPRSLDDISPTTHPSITNAWHHLQTTLLETTHQRPLRKLIYDSIAVEGGFAAIKDYLQIVAQACAVGLPIHFARTNEQRTAVISGAAYATLHFLSSRASRAAHHFESSCGGTEPAVARIYQLSASAMILLAITLACGTAWPALALLIILGSLQNLWRPIHIGRFDRDGNESHAATLLSIESQVSSLATAAWAPLIGWAIDLLSAHSATPPITSLWPASLVAIPIILSSIPFKQK